MSLSLSLAKATYERALEIGADKALLHTEQFMRTNNIGALLGVVHSKLTHICTTELEQEKVHIHSATKISDEVLRQIKQSHKTIDETDVEVTIDPELIAGYISKYKGKAIDTSVQTIISKLHIS